mmetsp:Transcript_111276/g.197057  ORF Transcript_111276/g.197057 Transcript_111276/m.197057 type:complete len:116 (-) Transcript_111276:46-393(-)
MVPRCSAEFASQRLHTQTVSIRRAVKLLSQNCCQNKDTDSYVLAVSFASRFASHIVQLRIMDRIGVSKDTMDISKDTLRISKDAKKLQKCTTESLEHKSTHAQGLFVNHVQKTLC